MGPCARIYIYIIGIYIYMHDAHECNCLVRAARISLPCKEQSLLLLASSSVVVRHLCAPSHKSDLHAERKQIHIWTHTHICRYIYSNWNGIGKQEMTGTWKFIRLNEVYSIVCTCTYVYCLVLFACEYLILQLKSK